MIFKAVIFDMDGVLIDSISSAYHVRKTILAGYGIDIDTVPDPQHDAHRGSSASTFLRAVNASHDVIIDEEQFKRDGVEAIYQDLLKRGVSADPALIRFLEELQAHGITCAITSSGTRKSITNKLSILGIEGYFSCIVAAEDVKAHKPDPEPYVYTMRQLGLAAGDCVVIEDSSAGVHAARAAKVPVIGFAQYTTDEQPLVGVMATVDCWDTMTYDYLTQLVV